MLRFYAYKGCDGCRKARRWLKVNNVTFKEIAIREHPPTVPELEQALKAKGCVKPLFNTSGMDYRQSGMKDKLPRLTSAEALRCLADNGNLVKRPFLIDPDQGISLIGFKENEWFNALQTQFSS
jgi:arsenate reductase